MYHCTVIIILILSYSNPGHAVHQRTKWYAIQNDLTKVREGLKNSKYWNYHSGLQLYTASSSNSDTCEISALDCYVKELQVILEEIHLSKEPNDALAENIIHHVHNILINAEDSSVQNGACKKKCEEYEEQPLEQFIDGFISLMQKMQNTLKI